MAPTVTCCPHGQALEVKSNRSRATTPRLSAEDRAELREDRKAQAKAKLPSGSLIQKETCEDAKFVQTGEKLGEGRLKMRT